MAFFNQAKMVLLKLFCVFNMVMPCSKISLKTRMKPAISFIGFCFVYTRWLATRLVMARLSLAC